VGALVLAVVLEGTLRPGPAGTGDVGDRRGGAGARYMEVEHARAKVILTV
jgi:hypothetical protein